MPALITAREERAPEDASHWKDAPLDALIQHLLERYHRPLEEDLERLRTLADRVFDVHGAKDPERLRQVVVALMGMEEALAAHLAKEEQVLFPWILSGRNPPPSAPIRVMQAEHVRIDAFLAEIREITNGFVVPEEACRTWRMLWEGLERLERDLDEHTWLEDEVLFPRALGR
jgi:regulator of cell morphogenesis and NO signaling